LQFSSKLLARKVYIIGQPVAGEMNGKYNIACNLGDYHLKLMRCSSYLLGLKFVVWHHLGIKRYFLLGSIAVNGKKIRTMATESTFLMSNSPVTYTFCMGVPPKPSHLGYVGILEGGVRWGQGAHASKVPIFKFLPKK